MSSVLIIFNVIPDEVKLYFLSVDDETLSKLRLIHGSYINTHTGWSSEVLTAFDWFVDWLVLQKPVYSDDPVKSPFQQVLLNCPGPFEVVVTGILG